jgi:hypothetical protein
MTRTQNEPDFAERPPWTRPGFIAAAVLLALVVLVAVAVALFPSANNQANPTPTPTTGGTAIPPITDTTGASGGPTDTPTVAPSDVTWQLVGTEAVPVSPSAGPFRVSGGTASGYAHTPTGALIAVAQLAIRSGREAGRSSWEPTITEQFVPSADRDKLLAALRPLPPVQVAPGELPQISGFRFISYTEDTAVVGLIFRPAGSQYTITTQTVLWRDGDWRMVAPPGGSWLALTQPLNDLSNIVEWGPR